MAIIAEYSYAACETEKVERGVGNETDTQRWKAPSKEITFEAMTRIVLSNYDGRVAYALACKRWGPRPSLVGISETRSWNR